MQPWQEDNVIFFKVAHIDERAGYLGQGILGSGVYKYIITPYYLIYSLFGYKIIAFYALDLFFLFLATVAVFLLGKNLMNRQIGMMTSFLFAVGYIAYDGFVRVYNSISSSLGVTFLSLLLISYWKFYKSRAKIFYILAVFFYFCAVEFSYIRSHYLILPVIVFELLFFSTPIKLSKIGWSLLRLIPFIFIFYREYMVSSDSRAASTIKVAKEVFEGKLENTFSFTATLGNLLVPDKVQEILLLISSKLFNEQRGLIFSQAIILLIFNSLVIKIIPKIKYKNILVTFFSIVSLGWLFLSRDIYMIPTLIYSNQSTVLSAFIGGLGILLTVVILFRLKDDLRKLILFFAFLIAANIAAYSAYTPFTPYPSGYRYLAQSNIGWISILVLLTTLAIKKSYYKYVMSGFIIWGIVLLILGLTNMNNIVNNKSRRIESFYTQLKSHVQEFPKGSLILFDIQDDPIAHSWYDVSFSVAEMPNTTAIAWRWGIDRYDIKMFTEFPELISTVKDNKVDPATVYTFFLTKDKLYNTTFEFRKSAVNSFETPTFPINSLSRPVVLKSESNGTSVSQEEVVVDIHQEVISLVPIRLDLKIKASPLVSGTFPIKFGNNITINSIYTDPTSRLLAFDYRINKERILKDSNYFASSQWKDRIVDNLHDGDLDTIWQSDRILWAEKQASFTIDLNKTMNIGGLAWVNGSPNNTPTKYKVEASLDGASWKEVYSASNIVKINTKEIQQVQFKPIDAKLIKVTIEKTISGDSPAVAEAWVIPTKFSQLNIRDIEGFLGNPFAHISSQQSFMETFTSLGGNGNVKVFWMSDKSKNWISTNKSIISVHYDDISNTYSIEISPSGTRLKKIKLSDFVIPGEFTVESLQIKNITLR